MNRTIVDRSSVASSLSATVLAAVRVRAAQDDARQIVRKRSGARGESQRYEGSLQVIDAQGQDRRQALDVHAARLARQQQGRPAVHRAGRR